MQMPGSIAAADLPCDDRPSDAAFGHVVFGRNATILRPLKDPLGDILRSAALSPVAPCSHASDARSNITLDSSVECLTQRRREAESAENARNLANTMNYASNLLEAKKFAPYCRF